MLVSMLYNNFGLSLYIYILIKCVRALEVKARSLRVTTKHTLPMRDGGAAVNTEA